MRRIHERQRHNRHESLVGIPEEPSSPQLHGDEKNVAVLFFLYLLQGIPIGLSSAIPMLLQNRGVSYRDQAQFSFTLWPFSLKLLWAPIVDSLFVARIGRRKTWLIPIQYLIGIFMLYLSLNIDLWLGSEDKSTNTDITQLTLCFFVLNFLAATQDVVVDGWALTMLKRCNVGYASTCNSVGQTAGYFLGYILFLAFESADFCNNYIRFTPQPTGIVTISDFLYFWAVVFFVTTTLVAIFKSEQNPENLLPKTKPNVKDTYIVLWKILQLPTIKATLLVLLTSKIAFSACDAVAPLKLIEGGVPKETLASLSIPLVPVQIMIPLLVSKYLMGPRPMDLYLKSYPYRLCFSLLVIIFVWQAPMFVHDGVLSTLYILCVVFCYILIQVAVNTMFVSIMAFFARISDPAVGGTYMTLLNTVNNLGGMWPTTVALWMVEPLTFQYCWEDDAEKKVCLKVDGYYIESIICFLIGLAWLLWAWKKIKDLQGKSEQEWKVVDRFNTPLTKISL